MGTKNKPGADEVAVAKDISIHSCPHGVWLRLHDRDGAIFAVAVVPFDTAGRLAAEIAGERLRRDPAVGAGGDCGHA